jgi:hypothetical protein
MMTNRGNGARRVIPRSAAQLEWNGAVACASEAWEFLTDEERLTWRVAGSNLRMTGQRYFVRINAPRIRDGLPFLTTPPPSERPGPRLLLKELIITNPRSQLSLKLRLAGLPAGRYTVWGSRPCNMGLANAPKCPRLGPLPTVVDDLTDVSAIYWLRHGPYIEQHHLSLSGKRIYIRLRQERDEGPGIYQQVRAVIPPPEDRGERRKKP